jgi:perosamine synthetase
MTGNAASQRTAYKVPYKGQGSEFGQEELDSLSDILLSGRHLSDGTEREAFETEFAAHLSVPHVRTVTSCTVALGFATYLCDLKEADEVITSPLTFQSTAAALLHLPVKVLFADIDPLTLCLDPDSLEQLVTPRTRAIFVTHYGGRIAPMPEIVSIADAVDAMVVEDCAHALGSTEFGKPPHLGHISTWSFHSLKNISTLGQGGALGFHDSKFDEIIRRIRAMEPDARFAPKERPSTFGPHSKAPPVESHSKNAYTADCTEIRHGGTNALMSDPAAAVGRVQLRKLGNLVDRRRSIAQRLDQVLRTVPGVRLISDVPMSRSSYHLYTFLVEPDIDRNAVVRRLESAGVEIILRYFPLHLLPEWRKRGSRYGDCPVTETVWFSQLVNLPIYPTMTDEQVDFMANATVDAIECSRR